MFDTFPLTMALNYVDFIILTIIGLSLLIGFLRGFTREFFGILGWGGALFITFWGYHFSHLLMRHWIGNPFFADLITIIIFFVTSLFILLSLSRTLSCQIKASVLGGLDRSLGILFGLVRGIVVCVIGFILVSVVTKPHKRPPEIISARAFPFLLQATELMTHFFPAHTIPPAYYHPHPIKEGKLVPLDPRSSEDLTKSLAKPRPHKDDKKQDVYGKKAQKEMDQLFKKYD